MNKFVNVLGKSVNVVITPEAEYVLSQREQPIIAEMELYFSCLIRKLVIFHENSAGEHNTKVTDQLLIQFHPVMSEHCGKQDMPKPLIDFPIVDAKPYVPKWLKVDFKAGKWCGEFGYDKKIA